MANRLYWLDRDYSIDSTVVVKAGSYIDVPVLNNTNASTEEMATSHVVSLMTHPSSRTLKERNKFAAQLDNFATFYWANINMFENFGAFIINEKKGTLKLYNGPTFKNNYSKTQFQDGYTNLTGVTFDTQTISFTIGVYWISIEDYRILMNLLHPYEINMLHFDFEKTYGYFCKIQSIKDSTRYVLGKEKTEDSSPANNHLQYSQLPDGNSTGYRYYTELTLTFEVMGAQCAKEIEPIILTSIPKSPEISWDWGDPEDPSNEYYTITLDFQNDLTQKIKTKYISDLDYPFELELPQVFLSNDEIGTILIYAELQYNDTVNNRVPICEIGLKNITDSTTPITLKYNSEHGLIYWKLSNQAQLLNLLSTQSNGERIVEFLDISSFVWPGQLNFEQITDCAVYLKLQVSNNVQLNVNEEEDTEEEERPAPRIKYSAQRRTNII